MLGIKSFTRSMEALLPIVAPVCSARHCLLCNYHGSSQMYFYLTRMDCLLCRGVHSFCMFSTVPQGKNRYHKFKDKIVELWRYMAVTEPPEHDVNGRLWKMGRGQWEMYKSLLVVAGKSPLEIQMDIKGVAGSPGKAKKKGRGKAAATISRGMPIMHHYDTSVKKNYLPSPLHELHHIWKMSFKRGDTMEMGFIRKDYTTNIRTFAEECSSGPDSPTRLLWTLEGLNELREIEHEAEIKKIIGDAYANVLQRYLAALNRKRGLAKK